MQPDGSTALIQAREDRELMKRVVIICKRSGNRELLEQASFESRKLYAQIYYLEKVKPENGELCDLRGEKERTK